MSSVYLVIISLIFLLYFFPFSCYPRLRSFATPSRLITPPPLPILLMSLVLLFSSLVATLSNDRPGLLRDKVMILTRIRVKHLCEIVKGRGGADSLIVGP